MNQFRMVLEHQKFFTFALDKPLLFKFLSEQVTTHLKKTPEPVLKNVRLYSKDDSENVVIL